MASKDGIVLPASAVKQLARSNGVCCLAGSEQGRVNNEYLAVVLRLWCVWLILRERRKAEEDGANCGAN